MPWYLDALGAAAASGVDVFCKEMLVGDWLETIRSWQGASGAIEYGAHPDFWVAALWAKLMGRRVLGVAVSTTTSTWSVGGGALLTTPVLPVLRAYAHCGNSGTIVLALANVGNSTAPMVVPISSLLFAADGAGVFRNSTTISSSNRPPWGDGGTHVGHGSSMPLLDGADAMMWVLTGATPDADGASLNGVELAITHTAGAVQLPSLEGVAVVDGAVNLPLGAVGFVSIRRAAPACVG
jgi:hypothetical protein